MQTTKLSIMRRHVSALTLDVSADCFSWLSEYGFFLYISSLAVSPKKLRGVSSGLCSDHTTCG